MIQQIVYNDPDLYPPIINATRLLAKAGWKVEILCRGGGGQWSVEYPNGVEVDRAREGSGSSLRDYVSFLLFTLRKADRRASIFVGHDMHGLLPAKLLSKLHRRPLVYHCHDFAEGSRTIPMGSRVVRAVERLIARSADAVIVPDAERAKVVERELRLKTAPLVIANSPPLHSPSSGAALRQAVTSEGRSYSKILFRQGRIGAGHAIEATIRSIPAWAGKEWGFVLMGIADSSYVDRLNRLAQTLEVKERILILPPIGYDRVAQFTPGADAGHALYDPININHTHFLTASNKIMEYMAAGLPLLVPDLPTLSRFVGDRGCGVTADETSPDSIAGAVNSLLGDPDRAGRMGAAARRAFEQEFCYERQFAAALEAYETLSKSNDGQP